MSELRERVDAGDLSFLDEHARDLVARMGRQAEVESGDASVEFCTAEGAAVPAELDEPRAVGVEQSNSSVVFGDRLILKAYRKLEAGINPELELLRFLSERG